MKGVEPHGKSGISGMQGVKSVTGFRRIWGVSASF